MTETKPLANGLLETIVETADELREKARHYRDLVWLVTDQRVIDALITLADEYEALAAQLDAGKAPLGHGPQGPVRSDKSNH